MNVEKFLETHQRHGLTVHPEDTLVDTARKFEEMVGGRKYSVAVVTGGDGRVVGVISLSDITRALAQHGGGAADMQVGTVMTTDVAAARLGDQISDLLETMAKRDLRHMPVVENGHLVGLVARRDALEFLVDEEALEIEQLRGFVFRSGARY